jgi:pimeloyl-ACP methyl ester carboxylesterase
MTTRHIDVPASPHGRAARLAVHVAGSGPLAVLVHGYPLDHRMWLDTLHGPLAQRRTLATLDLRGRGDSSPSADGTHTMELLAHDVAAVIRSLADGAVDVVGLSMGGYVAFALWQHAPKLVRSLVLANTRPVADSPDARAGRDASIATVVDQGRRALASAMIPKVLAPNADGWLRARVLAMIEDTPTETIVADLRGLKERPDRQALLPTISVPALVVTGEHDAIATPAESTAMAKAIPRAQFAVVPGCAHLVPMEAPAAFAAAVDALWSR